MREMSVKLDNCNDFFTSESIGVWCRRFEKVYIYRYWRSNRSTNEPSTVQKYPDILGIPEVNKRTLMLFDGIDGCCQWDLLKHKRASRS